MLEPELARVFLEEAEAHLAAIADEAQPRDARAQAAQALRDAAGLVGLDEVRGAAAEIEGALARRGGATPAQLARLRALVERVGAPPPPSPGEPIVSASEALELSGFFREEAHDHLEGITAALLDLERDRARRHLIDELMRKTHTLKGSAATVGLGEVSEAAHELEEAFALIRSGFIGLETEGLFDALMAAVDALRAMVESRGTSGLGDQLRQALARIRPGAAGRRGRARRDTPAPIDKAPTPRRRAGTAPPADPARSTMPGLRLEDLPIDDRRAPQDRRREDHQVRVDSERLDQLMDAAGELVFDRTRIERRVGDLRNTVRDMGKARAGLRSLLSDVPDEVRARLVEVEDLLAGQVAHVTRVTSTLLEDTEALRRTTAMLQDGLTHARLTSVRMLFQRIARPLRDAEHAHGKRVDVVLIGEDTELDKAVVDKITDPLIQLLRNALAHGIEPAALREQHGKPPVGRITLAASQQGDSVFLEVADDGAGIDVGKIRSALAAAGRPSPEATDEQIVAAIFEPGISSRERADALAGRGFGLDVVRESIARLGGEVTVTSSAGQGTRFVVRLPLTTAITQAFLFKVLGQVYALPNAHVAETLTIEAPTGGGVPEHVVVRGQAVPVVSLQRVLGGEAPGDPRRIPVVVLDFAGRRLAATCDRVVGAREIVVKSLGPLLAPLPLYAGATISGAGKVQLILDPAALVKIAYPTAADAPQPLAAETTGSYAVATTATLPVPDEARARVLVVDDSRTVREAISRMLAADGLVVDSAGDGEEAWEMLHQVRYDLLITDLEMPRLAGTQLIVRVRADERLAELKVLVVSSRSQRGAAGADEFLAKPVTRQALAPRVAQLLRRTP